MTHFHNYLKWLPEGFFILSVLCYWYLTGSLLNPVAIIALLLLIVLILIRNRTYASIFMGSTLAMILSLATMYLFMALISEYNEFVAPTKEAIHMLVTGSVYLGLNLLMAIFMLAKYIRLH